MTDTETEENPSSAIGAEASSVLTPPSESTASASRSISRAPSVSVLSLSSVGSDGEQETPERKGPKKDANKTNEEMDDSAKPTNPKTGDTEEEGSKEQDSDESESDDESDEEGSKHGFRVVINGTEINVESHHGSSQCSGGRHCFVFGHQMHHHIQEEMKKRMEKMEKEAKTRKEKEMKEIGDVVDSELAKLTGLDTVRKFFDDLKFNAERNKIVRANTKRDRYHAIFQGNPGTGKYQPLLYALGVVKSPRRVKRTGTELTHKPIREVLEKFNLDDDDDGGGVLIVDEAYQLVAPHAGNAGRDVLDTLLTNMEDHSDKFVVVFTGYKNDLEAFFAHNDGLPSRIPHVIDLEDFNDDQLLAILLQLFQERFDGRAKLEEGRNQVYLRAAIRRLSAGRGKRGFGNARSVESLFMRICERQARRLRQTTMQSFEDCLFFTKEDIFGPPPSDVRETSLAYRALHKLVGLEQVKESVEDMIDMIEENYKRELEGKRPLQVSLSRVFVGSPGTGKTTVGVHYGRLLADLGLLSNGDVVIKSPCDFIGKAVGESEAKTKAILATTVGKVLIIDEAYMLDPGRTTGNTAGAHDNYRMAVLDMLVAEVQGNPGDDRCVILLGYEDQIQSLFYNGNPGLAGRFMWDKPFRFENYTQDQLLDILILDLNSYDLTADQAAIDAAMGVLSRAMKSPQFSNGREVRNLVSQAILNYQTRQRRIDRRLRQNGVLTAQDFDLHLEDDGTAKRTITFRSLLNWKVSESVIEQLEKCWPESLHLTKQTDALRLVPRTYLFKGPPGTGKSEVARQLGELCYQRRLLSSPSVVEYSGADLIGQHVGHTPQKARAALARGIGKVLVINDIQQLLRGGYSSEALDELASYLRKHSESSVIVLTGNAEAANSLMKLRPDLAAFFHDEIVFDPLSASESLKILDHWLKLKGVLGPFFESPDTQSKFERRMQLLMKAPSWSNASDIAQLTRRILRAIPYNMWRDGPFRDGLLCLTNEIPHACIREMYETKWSRAKTAPNGGDAATNPSSCKPDNSCSTLEAQVHQQDTTPQEAMAEKKDKKKQKAVEEVLKDMGVCVQGYRWRREGNGWRCEGGSHYVSDSQIERYQG
ncbi:hypothetical protein VTJ83DRAFT_74 [Remersonia thermophila]|uniref:AAA+ ATPase domain-containing protein n=1 Tax=Remersonia thermophila TaxID=72144 RepID=A0ABR4DJY8_9PEZI